MTTPAEPFFGIGCNHLHDFQKHRMALDGLSPAELVPVESILSGTRLEALCKGGLPCYWTDEGAVLAHPLEVLQWIGDIRTWDRFGCPELLADTENWARELCTFTKKVG